MSTNTVILTATYVSQGVKNDGGGWIIVGGKFKKIPPRSPSMRKIVAALQTLDHLSGLEDAGEIQLAAEKLILKGVEEIAREKVPVKST